MSCVSQIQLEANRENAKRSTGPRTNEGKANSSRNAMKFGIFSSQVLLPGEDAAVFESFRDGMYRRLDPRDELERMLADRVVLAAWKLRRVQAAEAFRYAESREKMSGERVIGKLLSVPPTLGKIMAWHHGIYEQLAKHEAALERSMYRAMAELRRVQAQRGEEDGETEENEEKQEAEGVEPKNEPISKPAEVAAVTEAAKQEPVCENEPISALSARIPGEGRGEGVPRHAPNLAQDGGKPSP